MEKCRCHYRYHSLVVDACIRYTLFSVLPRKLTTHQGNNDQAQTTTGTSTDSSTASTEVSWFKRWLYKDITADKYFNRYRLVRINCSFLLTIVATSSNNDTPLSRLLLCLERHQRASHSLSWGCCQFLRRLVPRYDCARIFDDVRYAGPLCGASR